MSRNPIVGGIGFELTVDDSKFIQQLRKAGERGKRELTGTVTAADRLADGLRGINAAGERAMRGVAGQTELISAEMAKATKHAHLLRNAVSTIFFTAGVISRVQTVADFSQSISTLEAVSGAAGAELEALRNKALELGGSTRFSATEAANAMGELARAGFAANEVLAAIGPTLSAAQAGGADIASTAEIIGSTIRGFGIEAGEAARVADVLAQASNSSNAGILDLGEALKFAAPTARQLGLDLEETVAVIGKLSDGGLKGGLAGRGFQSLATQIVNNRKAVQDLIGDFNLAEDGLGGVLRRLKEAGITTEQIIKIFRAENLDTFGILANAALDESLAGLDKTLRDAEGSSARAAAVMDDNLNGALAGLSSRIEALTIALGDAGASGGLMAALDGLSALLKIAAENADILAAVSISLALKAIIPLAVAVGGQAVTAVRALQAQMLILNAIAGKSATGLTGVARAGAFAVAALGPVTIAVAAAAAAYVALARHARHAEDSLTRAEGTLEKYKTTVQAVEDDTRQLAAANDRLRIAIESQGPAAQAAATAEVDAINRRLTANEALAASYKAQLAAQIAIAEEAVDKRATAVEIAGADIAGRRRSGASQKEIADALEQYRTETRAAVREAIISGRDLTPDQSAFAQVDAERSAMEERAKALRKAYIELDALDAKRRGKGGDFRDLFEDPPGAAGDAPPGVQEAADAVDGVLDGLRSKADAVSKEFTDLYESPMEALQKWRDEAITAIDAVATSEDDRARRRRELDAVYQERYDGLFIKEQEAELAAVNAETAKQAAIDATLAARDDAIALQIAEARGDEAAVKALEAKADRQERINDLMSEGLLLTEATARADAEIAAIKAGMPGEAEAARRAFSEGLAGDIQSALSNAVQSGDYGAIFQEIINSSAARGLEDAITDLSQSLADLFSNLIFGQNGAGGALGDIALGGFTPPIFDPATAGAAADAVSGSAEAAAAASVAALGTAATAGAAASTAAATADTTAAAASASLAAALTAATLAAQAAASALATVAASGTGSSVSTALNVLPFGGGRARGGPVIPGKFYEVNEGGIAELLSVGNKKFLLPGASGQVTPLTGAKAPPPAERTVARHDIYVHGTGNAEIQRAVDQGVQRSVRIARAQAGPAAAEFQTRKL